MSSYNRDFAAPSKRRPGRPPNVKGKGGPATYVPSNTNRPGTNNNSPMNTPPRSPSEASLASNRDINSDGVLSPLGSPPPNVILPPAPVLQQLPVTPLPNTRAPTPLAAPKVPVPPPQAPQQPLQAQVNANVALPPAQDLVQLQQRVDNLAESNRRHGILLGENSSAI